MKEDSPLQRLARVVFCPRPTPIPERCFPGMLLVFLLLPGLGEAADINFTLDDSMGRLGIAAISASGSLSPGEQAANAVDGDLRTHWAAPGMQQWITIDLGAPQQISMTRISFTAYQWDRRVDYALAISQDGSRWDTVEPEAQSLPGAQWNEINLDEIVARYVRITINNATQLNKDSVANSEINEIQILGRHIPPVRLQVPAITASAYDIAAGAVPEQVLDGELRTYWSAPGFPQWVALDLGTLQQVSMARISFTAYHWGRNYGFTIATSLDGVTWTDASTTTSIPYQQWTEVAFTPINARFVRVTVNASPSAATRAEINEIQIFGAAGIPAAPAALLTLNWDPDPTGATLGYIVYYGATAETANLEVSNIPVGSTGFDPQAPARQFDPYGDLGLLPGDNVCFRLKAYNDNGLSGWSAPVCGGV